MERRVGYAATLERVYLVIAWYSQAIYCEERCEVPDQGRIERLMAERRECVLDRQNLGRADTAEIERMAQLYAERYHRLSSR